jgi:hypothetical protein
VAARPIRPLAATGPRPEGEPETIEDYQQALEWHAHNQPPVPQFDGDGIVIIGAGKYWLGACLAAKMARELGWAGGIEIWHRETEAVTHPEWIDGLGVRVVNANAFAAANAIPLRIPFTDDKLPPRQPGAWILKSFAVRHSTFRRVLFLDADAYPVANPSTIFDALRGPVGYWPNMGGDFGGLNFEVHPSAELRDRMGQMQGGQFLIDKGNPAGWQFLTAWDWIQQHADHYYRFGYGDQDAFRLAAAVCGTQAQKMGEACYPIIPVNIALCNIGGHVGGTRAIIHRIYPKIGLERDGMGGVDIVEWFPGEAKLWAFAEAMRQSVTPVAQSPGIAELGTV